jgi:hypothetical protein
MRAAGEPSRSALTCGAAMLPHAGGACSPPSHRPPIPAAAHQHVQRRQQPATQPARRMRLQSAAPSSTRH